MSRQHSPYKIDVVNGVVELAHGSGGRATHELVEQIFFAAFDNPLLGQKNDQAQFVPPKGRLVMSTDAHVIFPLFFPGGDIGSLSVHGTINDVVMSGAKPLYLAVSFILEEGFELSKLVKIAKSMASAAKDAGVAIVTGDTKVVERGKGDGVFITTTGVGVVEDHINISGDLARPGDAILLSGTIGDHGVAVMAQRHELKFASEIKSDTASLHHLVESMLAVVPLVSVLRDPTRGGLATTLNEIAEQSGVGMQIKEHAIPVQEHVRGVCELLGLDPLYVANEGKLVAICPQKYAQQLLEAMKNHPLGRNSAIIGTVVEDSQSFVEMETVFGGKRIVQWLNGEQLPRIC